jgi:hypothetical protein
MVVLVVVALALLQRVVAARRPPSPKGKQAGKGKDQKTITSFFQMKAQ